MYSTDHGAIREIAHASSFAFAFAHAHTQFQSYYYLWQSLGPGPAARLEWSAITFVCVCARALAHNGNVCGVRCHRESYIIYHKLVEIAIKTAKRICARECCGDGGGGGAGAQPQTMRDFVNLVGHRCRS